MDELTLKVATPDASIDLSDHKVSVGEPPIKEAVKPPTVDEQINALMTEILRVIEEEQKISLSDWEKLSKLMADGSIDTNTWARKVVMPFVGKSSRLFAFSVALLLQTANRLPENDYGRVCIQHSLFFDRFNAKNNLAPASSSLVVYIPVGHGAWCKTSLALAPVGLVDVPRSLRQLCTVNTERGCVQVSGLSDEAVRGLIAFCNTGDMRLGAPMPFSAVMELLKHAGNFEDHCHFVSACFDAAMHPQITVSTVVPLIEKAAELYPSGPTVTRCDQFLRRHGVQRLSYGKIRVTNTSDATQVLLRQLAPHVKHLTVWSRDFLDAIPVELCERVQTLVVEGDSPVSVKALQSFPQLQTLHIDEKALPAGRGVVPQVKTLQLNNCSNEGKTTIVPAYFPNLQALVLSGSGRSDAPIIRRLSMSSGRQIPCINLMSSRGLGRNEAMKLASPVHGELVLTPDAYASLLRKIEFRGNVDISGLKHLRPELVEVIGRFTGGYMGWSLNARSSNITSAMLKSLVHGSRTLVDVNLMHCPKLSKEGLMHAVRSPQLARVSLNGSHVDDEVLGALASTNDGSLWELTLPDSPNITCAALIDTVKKCRGIGLLNIGFFPKAKPFVDAIVKPDVLPNLTHLRIKGATDIVRENVEALMHKSKELRMLWQACPHLPPEVASARNPPTEYHMRTGRTYLTWGDMLIPIG